MTTNIINQGKHHWNLLLLAISFFSRLPVAQYTQYSDANMHSATRYFSVVGWLIAVTLLFIYTILATFLPTEITILVLIIANLLLTGALHEDGLADTADAFGGGFDKTAKLSIMKDSRLGTYGVCALIGAYLSKFLLLVAFAQTEQLATALFIAYPLSRALAFSHVQHLPYASLSESSKSSPLAKPLSIQALWTLFGVGAVALLFLHPLPLLCVLCGCLLSRKLLQRWMLKHIQGFTGDTLGAAQQIQEMLIYTILLANIQYLN